MSEGQAGAEAIARAFVDARHSGGVLADYPGGKLPASLDEAYRIQERAIGLHGGRVAGWKVGRIADPLVSTYGANRLTGPIFDNGIVYASEGDVPEMPVFGDGFAAAEAEYLLQLGDLPASFERAWTNGAVAAHVDRVCIGIEVASSPFPGINEHGPAVTVSDFGNNNGLVVGTELGDGQGFLDLPVALTIDGIQAGTGTAADMLDGPFGAVRFLFELARDRGLPLAAGQWISTGAVTGVHPVRPGAVVEAHFGDDMTVRCAIGVSRQD
ncbi:2-keto-4-pentenoate hydratase [Sphingomonas sp. AOB5]|uniref:2-keto-4-pentenoate hydratase n=1 Tax=Sphingomonas sp. AOB5 TaxID=3034017 RepID=UPI0023F7A44E|nr:2-keto-4-pentenoate hydratase [Sphingomonas sp. AOB5]MDF7776144.1 2-keto-4-pentenoate hydratase [Sphingomonas sp. AOB5]